MQLQIFIDNKSGVPIYEQIYSQIKTQIISGAPVVDQRTLAAQAGVSVGKVNALLRQAEQQKQA